MKLITKIICKISSPEEIYNYACKKNKKFSLDELSILTKTMHDKGIPKSYEFKLEQSFFECVGGSPEYIYSFAKEVPNLSKESIDSLVEAICETKASESYRYIYLFAKDIPNLSKENIDSLVEATCKSNSYENHIYPFAKKVPNLSKENIDSLVGAICENGISRYIYLFAKEVPNLSKENIDSLVEAIKGNSIRLFNENEIIYLFAKEVPNLSKENIDDLIEVICRLKDAKYLYLALKEIPCLTDENKKMLSEELLDSNNIEYIDKYALYVDNSVIFKRYGTIEKFYKHLSEIKMENNFQKDMMIDILEHKKYVYKI